MYYRLVDAIQMWKLYAVIKGSRNFVLFFHVVVIRIHNSATL